MPDPQASPGYSLVPVDHDPFSPPAGVSMDGDLSSLDPYETIKLRAGIVNRGGYSPDQASANRRQTLTDIGYITPVVGNVMSAMDVPHYASEWARAARTGDPQAARKAAIMAELSTLGAVTGLPFGETARTAAEGARDSVRSFAGPIANMDRAREMGFRDKIDLYHGTNQDITAFDTSRAGHTSGSSAAGRGVWAALDPETATEFANLAAGKQGSGQNILRLLHRTERPGVIHLTGDEKNLEISGALQDAWDNGYDAVMLRNYTTPGGQTGRNILVVKDPAQLRSPNAKFDPAKRNSSDLLAGIAGASLIAPAMLNSGDDH
jgi:hypothetical protein